MRKTTLILSVLVFLVVFVTHNDSRVMTSFDSRWSVHTAVSILREGNTNLDEYRDLLSQDKYYGVERRDDHFYSMFPMGTPVLAVPLVYGIDKVVGLYPDVLPDEPATLGQVGEKETPLPRVIVHHEEVERAAASFFVALAAVVIFLLARVYLNIGRALLLTFIFAFCTPAWSTASRALWQHGPSMLMLATTLYLLVAARKRPGLAAVAAFPLAVSYVVRPVNSISVVLLTCYVLLEFREVFWKYLVWALPVAIPFIAFNLLLYHAPLPPYFMPGRVGLHAEFTEALAGNLVSPARGLFVYSPVFLFCFMGLWLKVRDRTIDKLDLALAAIVVLHWVVVSSFPHWWGGHSFGPRFLADMTPYLVFFLIPVLVRLPQARGPGPAAARALLAVAVTFSFAVHYRGARRSEVHHWNVDPANVDTHPTRLWDWKDPQFLRGFEEEF